MKSNKNSTNHFHSTIRLKELKVQIATGVLQTPAEIAAVVRITNDPTVVYWAVEHKAYQVRVAAVSHKACPFGRLVKAIFFDSSKNVQDAAREILDNDRREELENFLDVLEDYPQMSFPFAKHFDKKRHLCKGITEDVNYDVACEGTPF